MPKSNVNMRELLESRVSRHAEKTFLFSEADNRSWTYVGFDKAVNRTANLLISNGIAKGDVVSLLLPNSPEYVISYFACFKIGALAGPVNSLLKAEEIEYVVVNSESKLMLANSELARNAGILPAVPPASRRQDAALTKRFGTLGAAEGGTPSGQPTRGQCYDSAAWPPAVIFDDVGEAAKGQSELLEAVEIGSEDDAIIIYTSGTTGKPKGCLLSHGNLIANARQITEWMGFGEDDRLLTLMPLFHMNAVSVTTMTALYAGASTVVSPKFSATKFWDIVRKYQVTSFGSVATMLSMLLEKSNQQSAFSGQSHENETKNEKPKTDTLRFAMCGSAPVPAEVLKNFEETFGCLVVEGYGLSESTCRSTFNPPNESRRPGSCGKPIGNEMKVFDENDKEISNGELGEIVLRGENIFKGYFKNPEATEKAFENGWFHTGDIGYRDAEGFFYIADRKSDMIIRGGENIYPREIDDLLYTHPAVASAAVIGVPDDLYGEEVAAFVVLKPGCEASEEELIEFCRGHLADYKCPKKIHFVEDIPKGPTGKLLKRELAKLCR
jgi:long-chain acyl-CoA synthetase